MLTVTSPRGLVGLSSSGEALTSSLARAFFDAAPEGARVLNLYGSTEVSGPVCKP
jgi:non-ribosomal peptide synthetase component F